MGWKRKNKFNAVKCRYPDGPDGIWYHSRAEAKYAKLLDLLVADGTIKSWIPQFTVKIGADTKWKVDFKVTENDGTEYLVEYKGFEDKIYRNKLKLYKKYRKELLPLFVVRQKSKDWNNLHFGIIDQVGTEGIKGLLNV